MAMVGVMALAGCASTPEPLVGSYAATKPVPGATTSGELVRWGGTIVETTPDQQHTCFQVLSRSLGREGRPVRDSADVTNARFVACRAGFYDPAVFSAGREVTFVGQTAASQPVKIGEFSYNVTRLDASVVYLWPVRPDVIVVRDSPWNYGPYWGPGWGRWGWW